MPREMQLDLEERVGWVETILCFLNMKSSPISGNEWAGESLIDWIPTPRFVQNPTSLWGKGMPTPPITSYTAFSLWINKWMWGEQNSMMGANRSLIIIWRKVKLGVAYIYIYIYLFKLMVRSCWDHIPIKIRKGGKDIKGKEEIPAEQLEWVMGFVSFFSLLFQ